MMPTVLWVSRIVFRLHSALPDWALVFPSVHPLILQWMVGIHVFCHLCRMFLPVAFVVICHISDVWFLRLLLD